MQRSQTPRIGIQDREAAIAESIDDHEIAAIGSKLQGTVTLPRLQSVRRDEQPLMHVTTEHQGVRYGLKDSLELSRCLGNATKVPQVLDSGWI